MRRFARRPRPISLTAPGGIEALLAHHRALYGDARMGPPDDDTGNGGGTGGDGGAGAGTGTGTGSGGTETGTGGGDTGSTDRGFPENTPLTEMTVEQQAAYWKHQSRKHETTAKSRADYDAMVAKAKRLDEIEAANATEQEKAVKAARDEAAAEERKRVAPLLVVAKFEAASAGRIEPERLAELVEDLDLTKYLTDKGEVDAEKVSKKVAAWAPKDDTSGKGKGASRFPNLGQGNRGGQVATKGAAGAAEAEKRFAKQSTTSK